MLSYFCSNCLFMVGYFFYSFHLHFLIFLTFPVGMGRYEKYVDRDVANAKPYRIRDSAF